MPDFPTFDDLFRIVRNEMLMKNSKLAKDAVDTDGTDANAVAAGMAAVADEVIAQISDVEKALYLDSAEGENLSRLAFDKFGIERKPAARAVGFVQFTTTTAAASSFSIPAGTELSTSDNKVFLTTATVTFLAGTTGPAQVAVASDLVGLDQQTKKNNITNIVSNISGAPSDLVVTNAAATAGAADEEIDSMLRARVRDYWSTARRGTAESIRQAALAFPGVKTASVFENLDSFGRPAKFIELVVTDEYTESLANLTVSSPEYETQSAAFASTIFNSLSNVRAAGIYVEVRVAKVVLQPIKLSLSFTTDNIDTETSAFLAKSALVNYVNALKPGDTFDITNATALLLEIPGLLVTGNEITNPAGSVTPTPLEVLRTGIPIVTTGG